MGESTSIDIARRWDHLRGDISISNMDTLAGELTQQRDTQKAACADIAVEQVACKGETGMCFLRSMNSFSFVRATHAR